MLQMSIIFGGLVIAFFVIIDLLPPDVSFVNALQIAGKMDKMNIIDTKFDLSNKYNIWSGIIGGFFLQLSYFGTDQSQVGRYLTGSSVNQSRMGLIMNAIIKIPMQFFILLIGVLVFVFYQFTAPPIFFNEYEVKQLQKSPYAAEFKTIETKYHEAQIQKKENITQLTKALKSENENELLIAKSALQAKESECNDLKLEAKALMTKNNAKADTNDTNFVFLIFVTNYLPKGLSGGFDSYYIFGVNGFHSQWAQFLIFHLYCRFL